MKSKKIMIIGGTGALGKTLTKRWIQNNKILVFSRSEHKQERMRREFPNAIYRIGDIKSKESTMRSMYEFKPDIIVNTAALKTVWVAQDNPYESVLTNIVAHQKLIDCVREYKHKLESLMFISTDKACSPINVYGMCKGIAEQMYVNFAKEQRDIKVALCRYGNVLNSTGSLIEVFKDMIQKGITNLPITNFEMTRFLITLEEAIDLIEWAYKSPNSHGKIVVPKLKSMKVIDLAKNIADLCGKKNQIEFYKIPIRNGEKLHEEMVSSIEQQRVEDVNSKYLMIGYERLHENYNEKPFSSEYHLMDSETSKKFLIKRGIFK
tara:strand:- start:666 stop:1628 length:963 start_codon:yes stop_codon:yes gene_type:complete